MVTLRDTLKLVSLVLVLMNNLVYAIDNPDAPDYLSQFNKRSQKHEQAVGDPKLTNLGILKAYNNYQLFLDRELNTAYQLVLSKLSKVQKEELRKSQQQWIKFRDAEFEFINHNWTRANFGSSFGLSRGGYRTSIIKSRVIQLLYYAINY